MVNKNIATSTEQKILEAAKTVFLKKGMQGARMQEIAEEAGINKALLHYYFRSKKLLFLAIFKSEFAKFGPLLFNIFNSKEPMEKKLHHIVNAYIDMLSMNPYLPVFIFTEIHQNPELITNMKQTLQQIRRSHIVKQLQEGIANGDFVEIKPEQFFTNLLGWCIFPFLSKPLLIQMFISGDGSFPAFLEDRKRILPEMIMKSIKK